MSSGNVANLAVVAILAATIHVGQALAGEETILTLTLPSGEAHSLSRLDLNNLQQTSFTTSTIWTDGEMRFSGVSLADLIEAYDITAQTVEAVALNNYAVTFPVEEALSANALLATQMNEKAMSVRDKGPVWIVFPFDSDASLRSEVYYSRSIWQLVGLSFKDTE